MSLVKNIKEFTCGTDSEFVMINPENNKLVPIVDYVNRKDDFGADEHLLGCTVEVRSKPFPNPSQVIASVQTIMQKAVRKQPLLSQFRWYAASYYKGIPLGSHIHFGISKKIISAQDAGKQFLDHYVGAISLLLEDRKQGLARRKYHKRGRRYGFAGDVREKNYGGFEYRPISCFFSSPHVACAMITLGKVVMYEAINNKSFKPSNYVTNNDFMSMNTEKLYKLFPKIWCEITKMALYPQYKEILSIIPYLVDNRLSWNSPSKDMRETWGIVNNATFANRNKLKLSNIWADFVAPPPVPAPIMPAQAPQAAGLPILNSNANIKNMAKISSDFKKSLEELDLIFNAPVKTKKTFKVRKIKSDDVEW